MNRGDVYLARFPYASASGAKSRPVLIVQADFYNQRMAKQRIPRTF